MKQLNLLIVEGNIEETRVKREKYGISPFSLLFPKMLKILEPYAQTRVIFPADSDRNLPSVAQLKKYDGVMLTGSALSVLDDIPSVNRQLNFAYNVFKSGIPLYGSCWGMQVASVVGGGKVAKSPKGIEIGISKPVQLTEAGRRSLFFANRNDNFKALCIHFDEVVELPEKAIVLAHNSHSNVQAMTFKYKKSQFFGVQYHPEFRTTDMSMIISFLSEKLVELKAFSSMEEAEELVKKLKDQDHLPQEISDYLMHTQEIRAWLKTLV